VCSLSTLRSKNTWPTSNADFAVRLFGNGLLYGSQHARYFLFKLCHHSVCDNSTEMSVLFGICATDQNVVEQGLQSCAQVKGVVRLFSFEPMLKSVLNRLLYSQQILRAQTLIAFFCRDGRNEIKSADNFPL